MRNRDTQKRLLGTLFRPHIPRSSTSHTAPSFLTPTFLTPSFRTPSFRTPTDAATQALLPRQPLAIQPLRHPRRQTRCWATKFEKTHTKGAGTHPVCQPRISCAGPSRTAPSFLTPKDEAAQALLPLALQDRRCLCWENRRKEDIQCCAHRPRQQRRCVSGCRRRSVGSLGAQGRPAVLLGQVLPHEERLCGREGEAICEAQLAAFDLVSASPALQTGREVDLECSISRPAFYVDNVV